MRALLALVAIVGAALGCSSGGSDESPDNKLAPQATKEKSEAQASAVGGGQFDRKSDRN